MQAYQDWIHNFQKECGDGQALCWYVTEDLQRAFPELKRRYGVVTFAISENKVSHDHHVWCETPQKVVVDPTALQFEVNDGAEEWEGIISRCIIDPHPGYHRQFCDQCQLQTFDAEPLPASMHKFASLRSTKVGVFLYNGAGQMAAPHLCPSLETPWQTVNNAIPRESGLPP